MLRPSLTDIDRREYSRIMILNAHRTCVGWMMTSTGMKDSNKPSSNPVQTPFTNSTGLVARFYTSPS